MLRVPIDLLRQHLRVDGEEEDAIIEQYFHAAVLMAEEYLNRKIAFDAGADETAVVYNPAIQTALFLMVGDLYDNRENSAGGAQSALKSAAQAVLLPYRIDMGV